MKYPLCLNKSGALSESDLCELEPVAFAGDNIEHRTIQRLLIECRRLTHELADPQFMYASGRISRHAILCRNAEIDQLREEVQALKASQLR